MYFHKRSSIWPMLKSVGLSPITYFDVFTFSQLFQICRTGQNILILLKKTLLWFYALAYCDNCDVVRLWMEVEIFSFSRWSVFLGFRNFILFFSWYFVLQKKSDLSGQFQQAKVTPVLNSLMSALINWKSLVNCIYSKVHWHLPDLSSSSGAWRVHYIHVKDLVDLHSTILFHEDTWMGLWYLGSP